MSFNSPVSGRKSYRKVLDAPCAVNQHEQSPNPEPAEISNDESENEELYPGSLDDNDIDNENDDSLEGEEIFDETFVSATGQYTPESANFKKSRAPSTPPFAPGPRRPPSAQNTNFNRRNQGGPHQNCVGASPFLPFKFLCFLAVVGLAVMIYNVESSDKTANVNMSTAIATNRCEALDKLSKTLPRNIFKAVNISVTKTLFINTFEPCVLMFLQEDLENANKTVDEIANTVINCFDNDVKKEILDANYFKSIDDPGTAIELVKTEFSEGGVLVVPNLQEIRGDVARAFHSICEKPTFVKKLVVFFTLTPHKEKNKNVKNPTAIAHNTLEFHWKDVAEFERNALITRVTDHVEWLRAR